MKQYISERITLINCLAPPQGEQDTDRMKAEDDNRKMNLHLSLSFIHIPVVCSLLFPVLIVSLNQAGPPSLLCWHRDRRAQCICNEYKSRYITSGYGPAPALNHFLFPSDQTADCINQRW